MFYPYLAFSFFTFHFVFVFPRLLGLSICRGFLRSIRLRFPRFIRRGFKLCTEELATSGEAVRRLMTTPVGVDEARRLMDSFFPRPFRARRNSPEGGKDNKVVQKPTRARALRVCVRA